MDTNLFICYNLRRSDLVQPFYQTGSWYVRVSTEEQNTWTDWDLSAFGIEQANNIGRKLSKELKSKEFVMYSSDLLRAKHTAEIVGSYLEIEPILRDEWNRLFPFFNEIMTSKNENIINVCLTAMNNVETPRKY